MHDTNYKLSKSEQEQIKTSRLKDVPISSSKQSTKMPVWSRIKPVNAGKCEESTRLPPPNDEQSKASGSSRHECEPVIAINESANKSVEMEAIDWLYSLMT